MSYLNLNNPQVTEFIDPETFEQVQDLDDDDTREFSRTMVDEFYAQAQDSFREMDGALAARDLRRLADIGHFLKGSAAALGLKKIKSYCEKIQHLGELKDETGLRPLNDPQLCLNKINVLLTAVKQVYIDTRVILKQLGYN